MACLLSPACKQAFLQSLPCLTLALSLGTLVLQWLGALRWAYQSVGEPQIPAAGDTGEEPKPKRQRKSKKTAAGDAEAAGEAAAAGSASARGGEAQLGPVQHFVSVVACCHTG